jgi:hypothetical protein
MGKNSWDGNIETTREASSQSLSEAGYDGNREYENGTYGQSDYTVRDRGDGTSDVYITSDSDRGHSHDLIDNETGEIIASYHDYLSILLPFMSFEELADLKDYILNQEKQKSLVLR